MTKFDIDDGNDQGRLYVMVDDKFDVRITRTDEGIVVDIYPYDGAEPVATTYAFDADVERQEAA